ncbi:hypothetical protein IC762_26650 [Bradyrhizobium genosp. L]|uniref:hypothetical protein n=1 Tax=Bradyrhizobium genosp. L TaxID=83637 RepID=UPI0018A32F94|nr:hypothetical protein [Bradyrhizobium genosp. L]QPF83267.1 hypothetical protein IC762_26650 [Bradyrhizobium genosp. L]
MPFIFDESEIVWPEDGSELPAPRADEFVYLPAPIYRGYDQEHDPVHFSLDVPPEPSTPKNISLPRLSFWNRLLGRKLPAAQVAQSAAAETAARTAQGTFRRQRLLAVSVPELRDLGVRQLYCRYDGGGDEGFAWLDHAKLAAGGTLDANALVQQLTDRGLLDRLVTHGVMTRNEGRSERDRVAIFVHQWLSQEFASMLLSGGFGTGEYTMYGAFTVDLDNCTVTDDPGADPVTQNRKIAR